MTDREITSFRGAAVALFESRLADETAAMVRRLGGEPLCAPSVAEEALDADAGVTALIDRLSDHDSVVIFLTGAAVARVFDVADRLGRAALLREGLARAVVVARGPKPVGALNRWGLTAIHRVRPPFTTTDVVAALQTLPVTDREVTVVHYGERNDPIVQQLEMRGALVHELMVYEWRLPADVAPLSSAIDAIIAGDIPILAFTSQIQVRHLLHVAGPDRRAALIASLNRMLVGAVGPTCASACTSTGIRDLVVPDPPKLGPLLQSLAREWSARSRPQDQH